MTIRGMQNSWKRNNPIHLFSHDAAEVCAARFPVAFYPSISDCVSSHREYRQLLIQKTKTAGSMDSLRFFASFT